MQTKILYLDSAGDEILFNNSTLTSYSCNFDSGIIQSDQYNDLYYSLINYQIPYSFYGVNSYNNVLDISEQITNGGAVNTRVITIPLGNFNAYEYATILLALMNANNTMQYTLAYQKHINRYLITLTTGYRSVLLFHSGNNNTINNHLFMGFDGNSDITMSYNTPMYSTQCVVMSDITQIYIKCNVSSINIISSNKTDQLLAIIPINGQPFSYLSNQVIDAPKFRLQFNNLNNIQIALSDQLNRPLDLNGLSFQLTIRFDMLEHNRAQIDDPRYQDAYKTNLQIYVEDGMQEKTDPVKPITIYDKIQYDDYIEMKNLMLEYDRIGKKMSKRNNIANDSKKSYKEKNTQEGK